LRAVSEEPKTSPFQEGEAGALAGEEAAKSLEAGEATVASPSDPTSGPPYDFTEANVLVVLDKVRPYLQADGGDCELLEVDADKGVIRLKLVGACGSCPSSITTMTMGISRRLKEEIPGVEEVIQVADEGPKGLELTEENVEATLEEIRPYLSGSGGGELTLVNIDPPIVKVALVGAASSVMTVRVAITQKLREKIPSIAAVQLVNKL